MKPQRTSERRGRFLRPSNAHANGPSGTRIGSVVARTEDGRCGIRLGGTATDTVWAKPTIDCRAEAGDRVLIAESDDGEFYVIARIGIDRPVDPQSLHTSSGAKAEVLDDVDAQKIQVRNADGALLFEYECETGRSSVFVPDGDLCLNVPKGRIDLAAAEGIQCVSPGPIQLQSAVHVGLSARGRQSKPGAKLHLTEDHIAMAGHRLSARMERSELHIARLSLIGKTVEATFDRTRMVIDRLETLAQNVIERFGRSNRRVEETDYRKAGRVVERVDGAHHLTTQESTIRARGTYRLDGEKIHIG